MSRLTKLRSEDEMKHYYSFCYKHGKQNEKFKRFFIMLKRMFALAKWGKLSKEKKGEALLDHVLYDVGE